MYKIEIDFQVFKEITARRPTEEVTANDVLRKLLGLKPITNRPLKQEDDRGSITCKGVTFPERTILRRDYKGEYYYAEVKDGAFYVSSQKWNKTICCKSPSKAANLITKTNVNGWIFWECQFPGTANWILLDNLRRMNI